MTGPAPPRHRRPTGRRDCSRSAGRGGGGAPRPAPPPAGREGLPAIGGAGSEALPLPTPFRPVEAPLPVVERAPAARLLAVEPPAVDPPPLNAAAVDRRDVVPVDERRAVCALDSE